MNYEYNGAFYVLTKDTLELLIYQPDALALYLFYMKQSAIQKTHDTYTTENFVKKGLHWGTEKTRKNKQFLIDNKLIEQFVKRENGKIQKHYIRVYFNHFPQTEANLTTRPENHPTVYPTSGETRNKCLIQENIEMLNTGEIKKEKILKKKTSDYPVRQSLPENIIFTLTESQYNKLITDYHKDIIDDYIERVNDYCLSTGKRYKDYSACIRNWLRNAKIFKKFDWNSIPDDMELAKYLQNNQHLLVEASKERPQAHFLWQWVVGS